MLYVIANAKSGRGRGKKAIKKITKYCRDAGVPVTFLVTERRDHARELAAGIELNAGDKFAAMGGDGTFHEVLNGLKDPSAFPVGFIPTGRGNDFARSAGITLDPVEAVKVILAGKTRKIDYLSVGDKRCLNVAGTGLDIEVLVRAEKAKSKLTYIMSLVKCLKHFEPTHITVTADDESREFNCIMAGVCNGKDFGGGIRVAPYAEIDDGKAEAIILSMPEDGKVFPLLPKFLKGKHMDMPITTRYVTDKILIETRKPVELDGEIYDGLPFDCRVVPAGLEIYSE